MNKHLFLSDPDKVVKLPNNKWHEYIPNQPTYEVLGDLDDDASENNLENMDEEEEQAQGNDAMSDDDSLEAFKMDEYGDIVPDMQPTITDLQLSALTVFDPDETKKPGSLF